MVYAGYQIPSFTFSGVPDDRLFDHVAELAFAAEDSGFDSVWVMDHFHQIAMVGAPTEPMLEAYSLLSGLAARTSRVDLGALVTGVTYRNPALLAKTVTTVDVVSAGRAVLGIGAAWNQEEASAYGYDFPPVAERFELLDDALRICRSMFTGETTTYEGRRASTHGAINVPQPVRAGGPPILVGGSGERKTLRLVAEHADLSNFFGDVERIRHLLGVLDQHCVDVGRDRSAITTTRLGSLVMGVTAEDAARSAQEVRARMGADEETFSSFVISGSPEQVAEALQAHLDVGLDGHIVNLVPGTATPETVALAGQALGMLR